MKSCQNCGKSLQEEMQFCPYCGEPYIEKTYIKQDFENINFAQQEQNSDNKTAVAIAVAIVIVVILLIIGILSRQKNTIQTNGTQTNSQVENTQDLQEEIIRYLKLPPDEFCNSCIEVTYDDIARYPNNYQYQIIKINGRIMQIMYDFIQPGMDGYLLSTNYGDIVLCGAFTNTSEPRILENDFITLYGISAGLDTYITVNNVEETVPSMFFLYYDIAN